MDLTFLLLRPVAVFLTILVACALGAYAALRLLAPPSTRPAARWLYAALPVTMIAAGLAGYSLPRYHLLLGEHHLKRGRFHEAIYHLSETRRVARGEGVRARLQRRAIQSWGDEGELDTALGLAYSQTRQCERARPLLDGVIDGARRRGAASRAAYALFLYAGCELAAGRPESARKALTEALLIDGKYKARARARASMAPLVDSLFGTQEL